MNRLAPNIVEFSGKECAEMESKAKAIRQRKNLQYEKSWSNQGMGWQMHYVGLLGEMCVAFLLGGETDENIYDYRDGQSDVLGLSDVITDRPASIEVKTKLDRRQYFYTELSNKGLSDYYVFCYQSEIPDRIEREQIGRIRRIRVYGYITGEEYMEHRKRAKTGHAWVVPKQKFHMFYKLYEKTHFLKREERLTVWI